MTVGKETFPGGSVAILPWGDLFEDFLDGVDLSLEDFADKTSGGWLFGYMGALSIAGMQSIIVCFSARVDEPLRLTHRSTGLPIWVLPASRTYCALRERCTNTVASTEAEGSNRTARSRMAHWVLAQVLPYLATPPRTLAEVLRRERCSVILCQEYEYPRFDVCVVVGRVMRLPVFASFQGGNSQCCVFERLLRPLTLRACTGIIVGSDREIDRVRKRYGLSRTRVTRLSNPLDASGLRRIDRATARTSMGVGADARLVIWHGRVDVKNKGLDVLLHAWKHLTEEHPDPTLQLLLVGTGRDAPQFRHRLDVLALQGVVWVDRYVTDRETLSHYLSASDVYAFPSRHEGFPVAPMEAMVCGLPVVAADAPGVVEILPENESSGGLIVPRGDAVAFARALWRILEDGPLRRELGRRARERAETAFSMETIGRRLVEVLHGAR